VVTEEFGKFIVIDTCDCGFVAQYLSPSTDTFLVLSSACLRGCVYQTFAIAKMP
jgi:hypothetical protein